MSKEKKDYLLGVNKEELERLEFQHGVWKPVTDSLIERLGVSKGWKVLDAGAGPGFVSFDLRKLVGNEGEVTALEPSSMYVGYFADKCSELGYSNMKYIHGTAEEAKLPENYYDLIFSRWVIGFVPDPDAFTSNLVKSLAPGGVLAIEDYAFNRLLLYPTGGPYERISEAVMKYWKTEGGDLQIAARIPAIYKKHGLELIDFKPNSIAGGPDTGIFRWHDRFITMHVPLMIQRGVLSESDGKAILEDWSAHKNNPVSIFFSPMVVDVAGKKAG